MELTLYFKLVIDFQLSFLEENPLFRAVIYFDYFI